MMMTELERRELMLKVAGVLGKSEIQMMGMRLTDTIEELVKVIEDERSR